ncbi:hypothetical protein F5877DRAFT_85302 [Lentinula edodes]|nr:hypothetical protein F5877DRAFT_85302 [Lentinula edodes]
MYTTRAPLYSLSIRTPPWRGAFYFSSINHHANPNKSSQIFLLASITTQSYRSSWFASDSAPAAYPSSFSSWTPAQYESFQNSIASMRDSTFDAWDESRLREWLLEEGIVAPKGPREEIVLVAKRRWRDWQDAKAIFDASASSMGSSASSVVSPAMSQASSTVATTASSASSAVVSYAAQARLNEGCHYTNLR